MGEYLFEFEFEFTNIPPIGLFFLHVRDQPAHNFQPAAGSGLAQTRANPHQTQVLLRASFIASISVNISHSFFLLENRCVRLDLTCQQQVPELIAKTTRAIPEKPERNDT